MVSPLLESPLEMAFVERDQEIQRLSAQAAAKSLADGIGFRRPHRRSPNGNTQFLHGPVELLGEDAVSVVDQVSVPVASWQCLTELLQGPLRGRMRGDVVMDHSPGRYFQDHEHVQSP